MTTDIDALISQIDRFSPEYSPIRSVTKALDEAIDLLQDARRLTHACGLTGDGTITSRIDAFFAERGIARNRKRRCSRCNGDRNDYGLDGPITDCPPATGLGRRDDASSPAR